MFKKCLFVLLALFVVVVVGIPDQQVQAEPAVVVDDFGCGGFVPNPDTEDGFPPLAFLSTTESHAVLTKSGVNILTCHFDHLVDLPYATGARGFLCGTVFGVTDDTKMIATPGGKATLVCKINGQDKL
jgi:hypothetical protein